MWRKYRGTITHRLITRNQQSNQVSHGILAIPTAIRSTRRRHCKTRCWCHVIGGIRKVAGAVAGAFLGREQRLRRLRSLNSGPTKTLIWNSFIYREPHDLIPFKISEGAWSAHLLGESVKSVIITKGARELHHQIAINTSTCFWCVAFWLRSGWLGGWLSSGVITEAILCLLDGKVR